MYGRQPAVPEWKDVDPMDDIKHGYREAETNVKKAVRDVDGTDLKDHLGNAGDEIRKDLGNLGDDVRRAARDADHRSGDPAAKVRR